MENQLKTVRDSDGKILYFSAEDFIDKIVIGGNCFICGAEKGSKTFNNEHIFPNWLLKWLSLHDKTITLPNGVKSVYSRYKISCCQECNTALSRNIEIPVSSLLQLPYYQFTCELNRHPDYIKLLFEWCALIYFKTHIRDMEHSWHLRYDTENHKIGERYNWADYHHLHCILRRFFTGASADGRTYGSMCIFPVYYPDNSTIADKFDYISDNLGQAVMLMLDQIAIICVLNDAGAAQAIYDDLKRITAAPTRLQLREIFSHFAYINCNLTERPEFYTLYNKTLNKLVMATKPPEIFDVRRIQDEVISLGEIIYKCCVPMMGKIDPNEEEKLLSAIKKGRYTFLFDENREFIDHAKLPK